MKILHINTYDSGGAFRAAYNLHLGLRSLGIDSKILVLYRQNNLEGVVGFLDNRNFLTKLKGSINYRIFKIFRDNRPKKQKPLFSSPRSGYDLLRHHEVDNADIINLHWTSGFLDFPNFFKKINKPIIWTLHDMHPFSSGFHYDHSKHDEFALIESQSMITKSEAISNLKQNITIVSPSKWLKELSEKSLVFSGLNHCHIPYATDTNAFYYIPQDEARKILDITTDKKILLFVADNIDDKRKGFTLFKDALNLIEKDKSLILLVGSQSGSTLNSEIEIRELGFIKDSKVLAQIYSSADLFVMPSLEDNFPNTVIESLCCGTPVVSFKTRGSEAIEPNKNGILANDLTPNCLAQTITESMIINFNRERIAIDASKKYDLAVQASQYLEVYIEMTN